MIADAAVRSRAPHHRVSLHSIGLVGAAAVYPALHSRAGVDRVGRQREVAGVAVCAVLAAIAATDSRRGVRLLAAGWAAHALFDAVHHRSESSLLPDWYPAACAGYDLALAARLAVPVRAQSTS